jgi:hypothetical protein
MGRLVFVDESIDEFVFSLPPAGSFAQTVSRIGRFSIAIGG